MLGTSGLPHLRIGVTSAVFHARANVLVTKELFTMWVIVVSVLGKLSLRILEDKKAFLKSQCTTYGGFFEI